MWGFNLQDKNIAHKQSFDKKILTLRKFSLVVTRCRLVLVSRIFPHSLLRCSISTTKVQQLQNDIARLKIKVPWERPWFI